MDDKYDKIEGYLKGRLSAEERVFFEAERETDRDLAEDVDLIGGMMAATGEEDIILMDNLVQDALSRLDTSTPAEQPLSETKEPQGNSSWWWKLLLTLLVMGGLSLLTYYILSPSAEAIQSTKGPELPDNETTILQEGAESPLSPETETTIEDTEDPPLIPEEEAAPTEDLPDDVPYAEDNTSPNNPPQEQDLPNYQLLAMAEVSKVNFVTMGVRSGEGSSLSVVDSAWQLLREKRFTETLSHLETGDPAEMDVTESTFLSAISHLMLENFPQAESEFGQITTSYSRGYDAEWYRLVALAAQLPDSKVRYEEQLNAILNTVGHSNQQKARSLDQRVNPE